MILSRMGKRANRWPHTHRLLVAIQGLGFGMGLSHQMSPGWVLVAISIAFVAALMETALDRLDA